MASMEKIGNEEKVVPITAGRGNRTPLRGLALRVSRVRSGIALSIEPPGGAVEGRPAPQKGRPGAPVDIAAYRDAAPVQQRRKGKQSNEVCH